MRRLRACVEALCNDNIALCMPDVPDNVRQAPQDVVVALTACQMTRTIRDDWRVTSYSGLQQRAHGIAQDLLPRLDLDAAGERDLLAGSMLTPHQFPRGASPGTFLHSLFEDLDFTQPIAPAWVAEKLQRGGFEEHWQPVISEWIDTILHVPLADTGLPLHQSERKGKAGRDGVLYPDCPKSARRDARCADTPIQVVCRLSAAGFSRGARHAKRVY